MGQQLMILIQQIIRFLRQLLVTKYLFNDYSHANLSNNNYYVSVRL